MTSLEFFNHEKIADRPAIDWGTTDLQTEKVDPTFIKAPTYLLKNQPINQVYRESNLELSNVRMNDQLMPGIYKVNMLEKQIQKPFPMQHPYNSHMSYNALFPNFTAPEDAKAGEVMLKCESMIYDVNTPSRVDDTVILKKTQGFPYRQELQQLQLPTQRRGIWYEDAQYFHLPKPNDQKFYLHPQSIHMPNPRLRPEERSIDMITANALKNKEKQLMQSTHQADFYKDGLGTQAPLNSDDLIEKKKKFDQTGVINETMKPYFKRGGGITQATLIPNDVQSKSVTFQETFDQEPSKRLLTQLEYDEILMETGKDYVNFPESYNVNNPVVQTLTHLNLGRSNTMPDLTKIEHTSIRAKSAAVTTKSTKNKCDNEKLRIDREQHDRVQHMQLANRKKELELITPDRDIRLLRIKSDDLENARGAKPNLKQSVKQHLNTFYQQEAKYFGERAQLYRTPVYNPYLVKHYIEADKNDSKITANYTSGTANQSKANFHMLNDTYEHRPKLFANKVFGDYELLKRAPQEQLLTDPSVSSTVHVQENGITHQQTTYGGSYNVKKFLQEHDALINGTTLEYEKKDPAEIEHQNIVLKSSADNIALRNYKNGVTSSIDFQSACNEAQVNESNKKVLDSKEFPRMAGPIPPEPYEPIYCATNACEMGDGYSKRYYPRVYDSPHVPPPGARYEPLKTDLQAMTQYEAKALKEFQINQEYIKNMHTETLRKSMPNEVSHVDRSKDYAARRVLDHTAVQFKEQMPLSNYQSNYSSYVVKPVEANPVNKFYKDANYTETVQMKINNSQTPMNILQLQDRWTKSKANKIHNIKYKSSMPDLRCNIMRGKKRIQNTPNREQYVA